MKRLFPIIRYFLKPCIDSFLRIEVQKKPVPKLPPKDESDSDATQEFHPLRQEVKKPLAEPAAEPAPHPAPAKPKPPVAGHKPVLPPKKPLPAQKKPKGLVKKPEETGSVAVKRSAEDTKDHVDAKPAEKEVSKELEVASPPVIKTDNVEEGTGC